MAETKARLQIVTGRRHGGDEEAHTRVAAFAPGEAGDLLDQIKAEICEERPCPDDCPARQLDYDAESAEDWEHVFYVDFDCSIVDGEVLDTWDGKRLRVHFEVLNG